MNAKTIKVVKTWSDVLATWVTILGAFGAGIFAIVEYQDKSHSERVKETLVYVDRFNKDQIQKAWSTFNRFWNERADQVFQKSADGEKQLMTYIINTITENKLAGDLELLSSFFENLRVCTCANVCDQATVQQFFGREAYALHGIAFPFVASQRVQLKDEAFGSGIELLGKHFRKKDEEFRNRYCASASGR